jgi:predicted DsbA family dithiol-disulfide isomerase
MVDDGGLVGPADPQDDAVMNDVHATLRIRVVEVFADVWCPFTHVGLRRLIERREELGRDDVVFRIRAWPLELVNEAPLAGDFVSEEIDVLREVVAPDLFTGFDPTRFPHSTIPALALAAAAYRRNDQIGEAASLALRTALFEDGRDISDPYELDAIARRFDLEYSEADSLHSINDDWEEGRRRGVIGSPHFYFGQDAFFCPTLNISRVEGHLQIDFDQDAFAAFTNAIFGRV